MIRAGDIAIILIGLLLISSLAMQVYTRQPVENIRVVQGDQRPQDYPIREDRRIRVDGPLGPTVIEIRDRRARIASSPCTQKLCIRAGWLATSGDAAACLPNRVSLALLGGEADFDAVTF